MSNDLSLEPRRTTWGACVQTSTYTGIPYDPLSGTTINEKYQVFPSEGIVRTVDYPRLEYFGIGRASTYMKVISANAGGGEESTSYIHEPIDSALYYQLPFIMRTLDNDIDVDQRANYAMRALVDVSGVSYIAYYLKRLDKSLSTIIPSRIIPATEDTSQSIDALVSDPRYLEPTPVKATSGVERTDGAYVRVSCIFSSKFTSWDIDEILNAKQILTGTPSLEITEIGIFSAIDKSVSSSISGSAVQYTEALRATLNVVIPHRIVLNEYVDRELVVDHDVGVDDPTTLNYVF